MRRIIILYSLIVMFFIPSFSGAENISIDKDVLEKILRRQDELEKKIEVLQMQLENKNEPAVSPGQVKKEEDTAPPEKLAEDVEYLKEEVEYMSDRLDKTEKKTILDRVQLGGEFRVQMDYLDFDNYKGSEGEKDGRIDELWSGRLRLNLRSEITENLIFNGRLTYFKYWGETNYDKDPLDYRHFMTPDSDGNLHVERAYIDYFIPETPFSLTFGRLPTSDGPPYGFKNYTTRKATWTQLFNDGEYDGIIANTALEKWTGLKDSMFRMAYAKIGQNYRQYEGYDSDPARVGVLNFETALPGVSNSLLWFGAYKVWDVGSLKDVPGFPDASFPPDSGEVETYTAHLQFYDIMNTGLGWFGSFSYQNIHPRPEGTQLFPGYEVGLVGDSLHGDLGDDQNGYAVYTGLRYILPIEMLKNPHLGFEYNYGSQYWLPLGSFGMGEFTNKLGVNGHAYELYYIQPISEKHMFCRIGAIYQDFDYYPLFLWYGSREGEDSKSDMSILNTYFLVDVRF